MRVALFITCVNDALFPRTGQATVELLRRLGVDVEFPASQTCCGQMHYNTGYPHDAAPLAAKYARDFAGCDAIVTPSGSCGAFVRDVHPKLAAASAKSRSDQGGSDQGGSDQGGSDQGASDQGAPPTYELSEFLVDVLGVEDVGAYYPHRVAYHPTCHSLRLLKVGDRPTRLLRAVRGLDLVELEGADECCGFGGTFSVKNPDVSAAMGADKVRHARESGAEVLCAADNSCLMHIGGTAARQKAGLRVVHLAEILASVAPSDLSPSPASATSVPTSTAATSASSSAASAPSPEPAP
jgi:L-lactate dehydrogenase complex protein LldE